MHGEATRSDANRFQLLETERQETEQIEATINDSPEKELFL
jgi:hypothetical protein